jgi:DNA mismatch repair protein MutS
MMLDAITLRNLEVHESIRGGTKGATLFSTLDRTKTPMGGRLLRRQLTRPLTEIARINARLDAVEYFTMSATMRMSLRELLSRHADIERITARIAYGNAGPRDLVALADSLATLPAIRQRLDVPAPESDNDIRVPGRIATARDCLVDLPAIIDLIRRAIVDDPPAIAKNGGVIRPGYSAELDGMTGVLHSGKNWIVELQQQEREKTGIKSLKVGYNRIFGYYIDVSKSNRSCAGAVRAPADHGDRGTVHHPRAP